MCSYCWYQKWGECRYPDFSEEEVKQIENFEYDTEHCPYFLAYWVKDKYPYQEEE